MTADLYATATGTRRPIPLCCCGCTRRWSSPAWWPAGFGTPLSAEDSDRYVEEMMVAAELVGVPRPLPRQRRGARTVRRVGPASLALYASGRRVDGLPARSAGPGPGHRGDLAGHPRCRHRGAPALGPADVRLRRATAHDTRPPDRNPAVARRPRRHVPRSARRTRGAAADHPADAGSAAGMSSSGSSPRRWRPPRPWSCCAPARRLRLHRARAALRLAARGGARYAAGAFAVRGRGRAAPAAARGPRAADWRAISEEIWPFVQGPAATPMGQAEAAWRTRRPVMAA